MSLVYRVMASAVQPLMVLVCAPPLPLEFSSGDKDWQSLVEVKVKIVLASLRPLSVA